MKLTFVGVIFILSLTCAVSFCDLKSTQIIKHKKLQYLDCYQCHGSGKLLGKECPSCHGDGRIHNEIKH